MADQTELDRLYRETQSALKAKKYDRAVGLLTQILVVDENYKDVSRLLANVVKLKRRRWYNDSRLWGTLGALLLIGLGLFIAPKISSFYATQLPAQVVNAMTTPSPIPSATATATLFPTPTPIPLTWKRISMGQEFQRDTVTAFATDKKDQDVIYAAMKNAGVYKTIDGGLSWYPAHHGLASTQVESLLIDSQNPQILYASTMDGIFKTEDGGENWSRIGNGIYLLMDRQDNSHLYARADNGIYETADQGSTWNTAYVLKKDCPDEISSWAIHPANGKMLFIGGGETCTGMYQSTNSGLTWKLIGMKDRPNLDSLAVVLYDQGNYSIFARFPYTPGFMWETVGWYASHDGGATWSDANAAPCSVILTADPENLSELYCGGSNLYVKEGRGDTWRAISGTESMLYTAMHIDHPRNTNRIIVGANDVSKTSDPNIGIFISEDGGISWAQRDNGLGSTRAELKIDPLDSARIYLATYFGEIAHTNSFAKCLLYRSQDKGMSWLQLRVRDGFGA